MAKAGQLRISTDEKRLLKAAQVGDTRTIAALIAKGVNINCGDTVGRDSNITALMYAAEGRHRKAVELLLAAGADVHIRDRSEAMQGGEGTALHYALQLHASGKPDIQVVETLLKHGADPNARLANGATALEWASRTA